MKKATGSSTDRVFRHLFLYGNLHQEGHLDDLEELLRILVAKGFKVDIETRFGRYLESRGVGLQGYPLSDGVCVTTDAILSIGGDGTFLHAAERAGATEVPVLGINTGHLGFLASYTLAESAELADMLADGTASLESRMLLRLECNHLPEDMWPYALNEVSVLKEDTSSMINVEASIDGFPLADYLVDGLVVSTPTGSTAYSMAAGGPIVEPTLQCVVLTPVAPHTLTLRPLVVGSESEILLKVTSRADAFRVSLDGRSIVMPCGTTLRVRRALFSTIVMRRPDDDFASILRNKLLWGRR